jgi:hypothetical protein
MLDTMTQPATTTRQRLVSEIVRLHLAASPPCACQNGTDECYVTEAFEDATDAELAQLLEGERRDQPAEAT